jgi:hypothetical protein
MFKKSYSNSKTKTMKDFVPYELSLELKHLGFDEPCFRFQNNISHIIEEKGWLNWNEVEQFISLPVFSQAFRFFRDKYKLFVQPNRTIDNQGIWYYFSIETRRSDICEGSFIYEEAELECLKNLIQIVKQQQ